MFSKLSHVGNGLEVAVVVDQRQIALDCDLRDATVDDASHASDLLTAKSK